MIKKIDKFSVVIPTKNRSEDLKKITKSILNQNLIPNELLIVDQSESNSKKSLQKIIKNKTYLRYFHKKKIKSLTEAKNFSLEYVKNKIIFFLEDDIILKKNFFKNIIKIFEKNPNILGVCGILINEKKINFFSRIYSVIFLNGLFRDERLFLWNHNHKSKVKYSDKISGGISGWRKIIFKKVNFDKKNQLHLFEDIDFSVRVNKIWPQSTIITTSAKVVHKWSEINRKKDIKLLQLKLIEAYKFCKKNNNNFINLELFVFIFGQFLICLFKTISLFNFLYLQTFIKTIFSLNKIKIYSK
jgi:GT2 family glycosyltransferase